MAENDSHKGDRLNKYLALELGISRREADIYIEKGRVSINGTRAVLGARIQPGDTVAVDGKQLDKKATLEYLAFHKPAGYVSSRRAQGSAPTFYELLPEKYHALKPVGRLDKDSSGLLLLTNDGDFAYQMTHPKFYKIKIYEVQLDKPLEPLHQQMISDYGVRIEDGASKFLVERVDEPLGTSFTETSAARDSADAGARPESRREAVLEKDGDERANRTFYKVTMREGRNRQIRRTFAALGYTVTKLHRTHFGNYSLGDIPAGGYEVVKIS